ncbi:MAG TPA: TonB-dependent receptor [Rhizorhapis sp.]|nr:TonB-dependent receptor [Rhizorhapis sp.]
MSSRVLLCALMVSSFLSPAAFAQEAGSASPPADAGMAVGDIIVTAQKRSERLNDVPLSISAATGEQLSRAGVTSPSDLAKVVTGFSYQPSNYGAPVYSIRGIGFFDNTTAVSPTVSVYVDQVPLPYLVMTPGATLDLERVEVLKGPQGTLFGQNSTGGAINFIAAKPTDELSFGGSAEYARFDQVNLEAFVSGPISEKLKVRLAARTEQGGAWQKSVTRPGDELGDRNFTSGRLILDWNPDEVARLQFSASGWIDKSETRAAQYRRYSPTSQNYRDPEAILTATPPAPDDNRFADWDPDRTLRQDNKFAQFSLRGEFDLSDEVTLTTITAYSILDYLSPVDSDGTQLTNLYGVTDADMETFSQEVRLAGNSAEGKLKWMLGGNYSYDDTTESRFNATIATNNGVGPFRWNEFVVNNNVEVNTIAAFGSLEYQFTDTLSAQGSVRYTSQQRAAEGCLADSGNGQLARAFSAISRVPLGPGECVTLQSPVPPGPPPFTPVGGFLKSRLDEDNVSWRGNLSWKPNSDVHIYANVTKGYKAGSFSSLPLVFSGQYEPVPQEALLAYEAGFKLSALDRTVQLSGAAFYYDYKDKQILGYVLTPFGNLPGLVTVPKSRVAGGEVNLNWRPVEGLALNGSATYVNSKVRGDYITRDPFSVPININGFAFPNTPKWQLTGDAEYSFPVSAGLKAFVGSNVSYRSSSPATFGGGDEFILPNYTLVDLRAGVESADGRWSAQIWGRNVFDKFYTINAAHVIDTVTRVAGKPATYGIKLSYKY